MAATASTQEGRRVRIDRLPARTERVLHLPALLCGTARPAGAIVISALLSRFLLWLVPARG